MPAGRDRHRDRVLPQECRRVDERYAIAKLDELEEVNDGRCPFRPVRHHFGITAFGINAWTGREAGDRIINEHDEAEPDGNEELYLVIEAARSSSSTASVATRLRARSSSSAPGSSGRRSPRSRGRRSSPWAATGEGVRGRRAGGVGAAAADSTLGWQQRKMVADRASEAIESAPYARAALQTSRAARASRGRSAGPRVEHLRRGSSCP
jgi:hypothetical protein